MPGKIVSSVWLAVACFALIMPAPADAGVKISTKTTYYPVKGKTGKAINASMMSGGGKRIRLSHAVAATETSLDFGEPELVIENGKCKVKDIDVFLNIRYIYPKWVGKGGASKQTRARWNTFWRELKRHEENHGKIAIAGAKALEKELLKMNGSVAIGCANFGSFAAMRLKSVIRKTAMAQKNFDRVEYAASSKISKLQRLLYESK